MASCAYCRTELEPDATACPACGRARLPQVTGDLGAPVAARQSVEVAPREWATSGNAFDDQSPLLEARDLPGWLRSLEERPPSASQTMERRARDDVGSWIVDEAPTSTGSEALPDSNPAESWLRPQAESPPSLSAAESVFTAAVPVVGGIQPLVTDEPTTRRAAGAPANSQPGGLRRAPARPPEAPTTGSQRVATIALILAIVIFLAALSFFIVTMARA